MSCTLLPLSLFGLAFHKTGKLFDISYIAFANILFASFSFFKDSDSFRVFYANFLKKNGNLKRGR